jgi:hypothetical protein
LAIVYVNVRSPGSAGIVPFLTYGRLHAEDSLVCSNSCQGRDRAEALPVASALGYKSGVHHRTKGNVNPFANMFFAHRNATGAE